MKFCLFLAVLVALVSISRTNSLGERFEVDIPALKSLDTILIDERSLLDPFIKFLLNAFIDNMTRGFPLLGIPIMDPLKVPDTFLDLTDPKLKVKGSITNVDVSGLATSEVVHVKTNLLLLTGEIGLEMPGLTIKGHYDIDGLAGLIFPIYGKGPFTINISNVNLLGGSKLTMLGRYLQFRDSHYDLTIGEFKVKFEGFLGGGELGDTMNEIVNMIGLKVFDLIEPVIHDSLVLALEEFINSKLREVTLDDILEGNVPTDQTSLLVLAPPEPVPMADAGSYVDQVLANLRDQMIINDLGTLILPDSTIEFSKVILGVTWHGKASIYDGLVKGLDTIHRSGPANLNVENGDIVFDAELEINDAKLYSSMLVKFMNLGPKASITGSLNRVKVQIKCRIANGFYKVTLEKFNISNLGQLTIDVKGLGFILNFLTEIVSEFIGNLVKGLVANLLEVRIKTILNDIIDSTLFPPILLAANGFPPSSMLGFNQVQLKLE